MNSYVLNGIHQMGATSTDDSGGGGGGYGSGSGPTGPPPPPSGGSWIDTVVGYLIGLLPDFSGEIETTWTYGPEWNGVPHVVHVWFTEHGPSDFLQWMRDNHRDDLKKGVPAVMAWFYYWLKLTGKTPFWPYTGYADLENAAFYSPGWTEDVYASMDIDYWPSLFTHSQLGGPGYHDVPMPPSGRYTSRAAAEGSVQPPPPAGGSGSGGGDILDPSPGGPSEGGTSFPLLPLGLLLYFLH